MSARRAGRGHGCLVRFAATMIVLIVAAFLVRAPVLEGYARWLIVEDPLPGRDGRPAADAVVALAGGDGERLHAAVNLYRERAARALLITGPDAPLLRVYTGEDSLTQGEAKRRIAVKRGVPAEVAFVSLGATSTWEEAIDVRRQAEAHRWTSLVIVTDPFHTRRTRATLRQVFAGSDIAFAVYHLPLDRSAQEVTRWWTRESDVMSIFTETVKLAFYWRHHGVKPWD